MKNYLKLLSFLKGHKKLFSIAVGTMFISSFLEIFSYTLMIPLLDNVFTGKQISINHELPGFMMIGIDYFNSYEDRMKLFGVIIIAFLTITLVKSLFTFLYQYLMCDVSQSIMRDIRSRLYKKIQSLSLDYFSKKKTGELISRITNDVNFVENAVSYGLTDLFRQTFTIIFCVYLTFTLIPQAAFVLFLLFPVIGIPLSLIGKRLKSITKGMQEQLADINTHLLETISGIKLVKAFNTEKYEVERFEKHNFSLYKWWMKSAKRLIAISPVTEIIGTVFGVGLMTWLGPKIIANEISFGVFTLFFASFMNIIKPAKKLGNVNALTQAALSANERIYDVLQQVPSVKEKDDAIDIGELNDSIKLDGVDFQYDEESGGVLKDINLEIKKGQLVAIVGPTGTGKTTLVNLIPRFYDPIKGAVIIDGNDLKDVSFKSIRDQIGIVSQETFLFNDTVKNNICYGRENFPQEEVEKAAERAFANIFIEKMPQSYDTVIGDRGFRLSGGEKQRISIARAIIKNPPILILDEATSALDSESEKFVQEALDKLMQGRTVIAIAHRLSTIKKADKIVVLDGGSIVGEGKHEELLKSCPLYEKLHRMQFQG